MIKIKDVSKSYNKKDKTIKKINLQINNGEIFGFLGPNGAGKTTTKERIEQLSKIFEINDVLNNKIESYSHGMRQKLIIIGSLVHNPNNWIIDEPMIGLDPKASYELKKIMREMADENKTVFFSTHILDVAEKVCDRIGIINNGEVIFVGTIEQMRNELKENKSLEELFMEITKNDK